MTIIKATTVGKVMIMWDENYNINDDNKRKNIRTGTRRDREKIE